MTKKLILGACFLAGVTCANGMPITPQQALERLSIQDRQLVKNVAGLDNTLLYTFPTSVDGEAAFYVFGSANREGYMLLSADDAAAPLLGYGCKGVFDETSMSPQLKAWLEEYARQISYAREKGLATYKEPAKDSRPKVEPLMKTIWDQGTPFDIYTPTVYGKHCPTGCVATAMAQVMKYWNYPEQAVGSGVITNPSTGRNETMQLGEEPFQWDDMLDSYNDDYTDEQAHAVGYLMKACGYGAQMTYTSSLSGAFSILAGKAMIDNFLYNPNLRYYQRDYLTATEWDAIIYNEVSNGRPVLYGAQSTSGGHEFVCDGYGGDGYYHFNWGWGGMSDGYFILNSLNPGAIGTGGGLGGGFNYKQDILVGVQPEAEDIYAPTLTQMGDLTATAKDLRVTLKLMRSGMTGQWVNAGLKDVKLSIGVGIKSVDGGSEPRYILNKTSNVSAPDYRKTNDGYLSVSYSGVNGQFSFNFPEDLSDGKYKVFVCTRQSAEDEWTPVLTQASVYNYIYVTKTGTSLTIDNMPSAEVTLDKAELISPLYYGSLVKFELTITNHSEKEMTKGFYPELFFNGTAHLIGDGIVLTIQPNETITTEFTTQFRTLSGASTPTSKRTYSLRWLNPDTNELYDIQEDVVMNVSNLTPSLDITEFSIANEETQRGVVLGAGMQDIYQIKDIENMEVDLSLSSTRGFFGYPLYFAVFKVTNMSESMLSSIFEPLTPLEEGDSCDISTTLNMSVGTLNSTYAGYLFYQGTKGMVQVMTAPILYFKLIGGGSDVDEIEVSEDENAVYYNIQGQKVVNPVKGDLLIKRTGTKIEKIVY